MDIAVEPIDGTRLLALGVPNAIVIVALADRGSLFASPDIMYLEKITVGSEAAGCINSTDTVANNLRRIADAKQEGGDP